MWLNGAWTHFHKQDWEDNNDEVVCRQLDFGPPLKGIERELTFSGSSAIPTHGLYFNCSGNEDRLIQCLNETQEGAGNYINMEYVAVSCSGEF